MGKAVEVKAPRFKPGRGTDEKSRKEKRQLVLRTAARMICERGYSRTSLDDIAKEVGVTKPTLYYYIKNKQDILSACREIGGPALKAAQALARQKNIPADVRLKLFVELYARYITGVFGRLLVHTGPEVLSEMGQHGHHDAYEITQKALASIMRDGAKTGSLRKVDANAAAETVLNGLRWLAVASDTASKVRIEKWIAESIETAHCAYKSHGIGV